MNSSTEITKREETAIDFPPDKVELLKRTLCSGATNDELELFMHACRRTGLDPFMRQIHAVKRYDDKAKRQVMAIQTGIDGYRLIADRSGRYAGNDDPAFAEGKQFPTQATVTVYKLVGGQRCPFSATARWDEYYPGDKQGFMWRRMPHVMLGKVAEALALRKAFPAELSGLYTTEEMEQAGEVIDPPDAAPARPSNGTPKTVPVAKATPEQVQRIRDLLETADVDPGWGAASLVKAGLDDWSDLPADRADKAIAYLTEKQPAATVA